MILKSHTDLSLFSVFCGPALKKIEGARAASLSPGGEERARRERAAGYGGVAVRVREGCGRGSDQDRRTGSVAWGDDLGSREMLPRECCGARLPA